MDRIYVFNQSLVFYAACLALVWYGPGWSWLVGMLGIAQDVVLRLE